MIQKELSSVHCTDQPPGLNCRRGSALKKEKAIETSQVLITNKYGSCKYTKPTSCHIADFDSYDGLGWECNIGQKHQLNKVPDIYQLF